MMRKTITFALLLAVVTAFARIETSPVDYVSTLVGTQSKYELSTGNTYPATAMPWGMNFWTPQTAKMGDGWVYTYTADKICGFKQTHQPSPWMNDYGQFSIMPITGRRVFGDDERASWFSHKSEVALPYYYRVLLANHDVTAELTPTERAAIFRFTFPETSQAYIVLDAYDRGSSVRILPQQRRIVGYSTRNSGGVPDNFRNYFVLEFDRDFTSKAVAQDGTILEGTTATECNRAGAIVGFNTKRGEQIHVRVASSFISEEQALRNLKEVEGKDFEAVKQQGRSRWNEVLSRIEIDDPDRDHLRTFYSCLYRSLLFPRALYEYDAKGNVVHYSPFNGTVQPGYMFTDTGFWDTFRSLFPLLNLLFPSESAKMQEWLVNAYKESGFLPEWATPGHRDCMVGNNSASVVADAYVNGIRGYDAETLWKAVVHGANAMLEGTASGRRGWKEYNTLGYVPRDCGVSQAVPRTLEYAYDDWAILQFGKALGKSEAELAPFRKHALNYRNVYNPERRLMVGRHADGSFRQDFDPCEWSGDFCEGNSWHWSFCVFHDPQGLINLMGGDRQFVEMLDSVFVIPGSNGVKGRGIIHEMREMQVMDMGQYAHGNQPIQHMPYLYNYASQPWKTQQHVREIMDKLYSATPDGYCGDEDNGQTSAWYVFSALGFYPVCPASNQYVLGSPYFQKVKVHLENGRTVTIEAPDNTDSTPYIQSMQVDKKDYDLNYLTHDQLLNGATITYRMSPQPNRSRGIKAVSRPYSFTPRPFAEQIAAPADNIKVSRRPPVEERLFTAASIEKKIQEVQELLKDAPYLAWMFGNCFPNTLDTTVHYSVTDDGDDDTFVYTGDIHAMWLRDSGAQVWPYVQFAKNDEKLRRMVRGTILRQLKCIVLDPYANAFNIGPTGTGWNSDYTEMKPFLHERKYEIDSLCYPIRLAYHYWLVTGDDSIFKTGLWLDAVKAVLTTFRDQQRKNGHGNYYFLRTTDRQYDTMSHMGYGNPVKPCGLIASAFRPSDDATVLLYLVPSNFFAVTSLRKAADILTKVNKNALLAGECKALADEVEAALKQYAIYDHPKYGKIYAYEVDGFGNHLLMDDANVPSLLAMAYLGDVDINDPTYQNTRHFVWSDDNPYFFRGKAGEGIGGPHVGYDMVWPMSIMMRAFTSTDDEEILQCIQTLVNTDAGTGFMHESFNKDNATKYTRPWFAWQNTLFGELILKLIDDGKLNLLRKVH